jgi:hypothetical protein
MGSSTHPTEWLTHPTCWPSLAPRRCRTHAHDCDVSLGGEERFDPCSHHENVLGDHHPDRVPFCNRIWPVPSAPPV